MGDLLSRALDPWNQVHSLRIRPVVNKSLVSKLLQAQMISLSKVGDAIVRVATVASSTVFALKLDSLASRASVSAQAASTMKKRKLKWLEKCRNGIWLRPSGRGATAKRITVVRTIASVMGRVLCATRTSATALSASTTREHQMCRARPMLKQQMAARDARTRRKPQSKPSLQVRLPPFSHLFCLCLRMSSEAQKWWNEQSSLTTLVGDYAVNLVWSLGLDSPELCAWSDSCGLKS